MGLGLNSTVTAPRTCVAPAGASAIELCVSTRHRPTPVCDLGRRGPAAGCGRQQTTPTQSRQAADTVGKRQNQSQDPMRLRPAWRIPQQQCKAATNRNTSWATPGYSFPFLPLHHLKTAGHQAPPPKHSNSLGFVLHAPVTVVSQPSDPQDTVGLPCPVNKCR